MFVDDDLAYLTWLLAGIVALAVICNGQANAQEPEPHKVVSLQSVVIDAIDWKVRVNMAEGHMVGEKFVADRLLPEFVIDPDRKTMSDGEETRGFDRSTAEGEGKALSDVMESISRYSFSSVKWWIEGHGESLKPAQPSSSASVCGCQEICADEIHCEMASCAKEHKVSNYGPVASAIDGILP